MTILNRQNFLFLKDAQRIRNILIPAFAGRAEIHKDEQGYWINVWWHCGIIAPLTIQETLQALGE